MPAILLYMHHQPTRFCVVVLAIVLPLVWALAPGNGALP